MNPERTAEQERSSEASKAYREGVVDERLAGFDKHFLTINGSIDETAKGLREVASEVTGTRRDISDLTRAVDAMVPEVQKLIAEGIGTKQVAEALSDRKTTDESGSDRWRGQVAWGVAIFSTVSSVSFLALNAFGIL